MDGISNVMGHRTITITVDGKVYRLQPKNLDEYAEREAYILSRKPNPLNLLSTLPPLPDEPKVPVPPDPGCSAEERQKYHATLTEFRRAKEEHESRVAARIRIEEGLRRDALLPRFVSFADDQAFDQSLHGIAYKLWRALRENHPEINGVPAAMRLLDRMGTARFGELQHQLNTTEEKDILGNSNGSTGDSPSPAFHGEPSAAGSPSVTAGVSTSSAG